MKYEDVKGMQAIENWLKTLDLVELNEIYDLLESSEEDDNDYSFIEDDYL